MAININDNIKVQAPKILDDRMKKPNGNAYSSKNDVLSTLPISRRAVGLIVMINEDLFYFRDGVELESHLHPVGSNGTPGVESVTGNIVDDTDPQNPTVNFIPGDYELSSFSNSGSDPFVRLSSLNNKVDKRDNMDLSSNDYTDAEKEKLSNIENLAQVNAIERVFVNSVEQLITDKSVNISVTGSDKPSAGFEYTVGNISNDGMCYIEVDTGLNLFNFQLNNVKSNGVDISHVLGSIQIGDTINYHDSQGNSAVVKINTISKNPNSYSLYGSQGTSNGSFVPLAGTKVNIDLIRSKENQQPDNQARNCTVLLEEDFIGTLRLNGIAISSGTASSSTVHSDAKHTSFQIQRHASNANSGYGYGSFLANIYGHVGLEFNTIFKFLGDAAKVTNQSGFMNVQANSSNPPTPSNGAYLRNIGNILYYICTTEGNETGNNRGTKLSTDTWYHARIVFESANSVRFSIYQMDGTLVDTDTVTTNVPIGKAMSVQFHAWASDSTTPLIITAVDYISVQMPPNQRGLIL